MLGKIIITGGSGFLGSEIAARLKARGISPVVLDIVPPRDNSLIFVRANLSENIPEDENLKNPYAVIHLAGAPIFGKWTKQKKKLIYDSRILGTKNLVNLFQNEEFRPQVFVSASAVGFYGNKNEEEINLQTAKGEGFLSDVCRDWEMEAFCAEKLNIKTTVIRNGLILGKAGLIKTLRPYYEWGIGGPIGNGQQWFPWVHVEDCAEIYVQAVLGKIDAKVLNAVAPEQIRNKDFSKIFAKVLKKPHFLFIPIFALKFLYGGFANEITMSQKVKSEINGYKFEHESLEKTLNNIL